MSAARMIVHWVISSDGAPVCGEWPEPLSKSPLVCGSDSQGTTDRGKVNCQACLDAVRGMKSSIAAALGSKQ